MSNWEPPISQPEGPMPQPGGPMPQPGAPLGGPAAGPAWGQPSPQWNQYAPPQPMYGAPPPPGVKPSNYLAFAILSTLFCCLPTGIVAIVFAAQVDGKWASGDYAGAQAASKSAKTWVIVSAATGLILGLLYLLVFATAASNISNVQ